MLSCIFNKINCQQCFRNVYKEHVNLPCPNLSHYDGLFNAAIKEGVVFQSKMSNNALLVAILGDDNQTSRKSLDSTYMSSIIIAVYDADYICESDKRILFDHFLNNFHHYQIINYHILKDHIHRFIYRIASRGIDNDNNNNNNNDNDDDNNSFVINQDDFIIVDPYPTNDNVDDDSEDDSSFTTDNTCDDDDNDYSYDNVEDQLIDAYELESGLAANYLDRIQIINNNNNNNDDDDEDFSEKDNI